MISESIVRRLACECGELTHPGQLRVLCACGRECHEPCCKIIEGAFHGPKCARIVREGEKIQAGIPAVVGANAG